MFQHFVFWFQNISETEWLRIPRNTDVRAYLGTQTSAHTRNVAFGEWFGGGCVQRGHTEGWGRGGGCGLAHIRRISCAYRAHKGELAQAPWNRGLKGFQKHALSRRLCSPTHEVSKDAAHSGQHDPRAYLEHTARNIPGTEHAFWFRNTSGTYRKKWTCAVHG